MTPDMIERARRAASAGGYENVEFRLGEIEALPVPDNSVDAVISNCVLNLSPARDRVFAEVVRVLKPGGRIMISDLISEHPTPKFLLDSTDALVGCLPVQEDEYLGDLRKAGLISKKIRRIKIIASGQVERALTVRGLSLTKGARAAIEAAGGKVEE